MIAHMLFEHFFSNIFCVELLFRTKSFRYKVVHAVRARIKMQAKNKRWNKTRVRLDLELIKKQIPILLLQVQYTRFVHCLS